jgi:hypothetical protein
VSSQRPLSREDLTSTYRSIGSPKDGSPDPRHTQTPGTIRTHESTSEMYSDDFEEDGSVAQSASHSQSHSVSMDKIIKCFVCHREIRASDATTHTKTCRIERMKSIDSSHASAMSPRDSMSQSYT